MSWLQNNSNIKIKALLYGHQDFIRVVKVCPFTNQAITGSNDHTVRTWNVNQGVCDRILIGHDSTVSCLTVLRNNLIISGGADHSIRLWDSRNGVGSECVGKLQHVSGVNDLTCWSDLNDFSNDYLIYSVGQDSKLNVWDIRKLGSDDSSTNNHSNVSSYSFDIMSGSSFGGNTSSFGSHIMDSTEHCKINSISTNFGTPFCCHVGKIKDKSVIFVGSTNGSLQALSLNDDHSYTIEKRYNSHYSDITCLSVENDILVSGDNSNHVKIFSVENSEPIISLSEHSDKVTSCQVIGSHVYSGSIDGTICQYSLDASNKSVKLLRTIERLSMQVFSLCVSKDKYLYCGSDEEALRCWDLNL
ncbi:predicted protein [Naegleria gruberi]|uniref:Predicted protein n=1 Tax=Naegleria gruberi TaxID=5762 RepID=D2VEL8_NAEGR|nr:uncharacterized protein NAEGRDRAFT_67321 [Naegleria gruberi]EFC44907.1 predicted protein [Naegleria gruberi]|eukprot:XP_002677651.1 predicted protein [Naegleria gruberi strain NEG-M]